MPFRLPSRQTHLFDCSLSLIILSLNFQKIFSDPFLIGQGLSDFDRLKHNWLDDSRLIESIAAC